MEDTLVDFIERHASIISRFRVTVPHNILRRVRHLLGPNGAYAIGTEVNYLGGDAQVATQIVVHEVGAALIFRDPLAAPLPDCDALLRLINVHNIMNATNLATAELLVQVLEEGLTSADSGVSIMPSFYTSLESPAVATYKAKQNAVITAHSGAAMAAQASGRASLDCGRSRRSSQDLVFSTDTTSASSKLGSFKQALSAVRAAQRMQVPFEQLNGTLDMALHDIDQAEASDLFEVSWSWKKHKEPSECSGRVARHDLATSKRNLAKMRAVTKVILSLRAAEHVHADVRNQQQASSMRCLALISHNNMKGAMKEFVIRHQRVLKCFRLTGTNSTMTMLREVLGEEGVVYGPTCSSGPLGGDAEVGALMCLEDLGGMFFFTDPLDPHPHTDDIKALVRMCDLHSLVHASNTTTGDALVRLLERGLDDPCLIPTFYTSSMSPAIEWHRNNVGGVLYAMEHQAGKAAQPCEDAMEDAMPPPSPCTSEGAFSFETALSSMGKATDATATAVSDGFSTATTAVVATATSAATVLTSILG